jgi:hypothetical protein
VPEISVAGPLLAEGSGREAGRVEGPRPATARCRVVSCRRTLLCCVKDWIGFEESVELAGDVAD